MKASQGFHMLKSSVIKISLATMFIVCILAISVQAETVSNEALQQRLNQQGDRIERLEEAIRELQSQTDRRQQELGSPLDDPLVGVWQCTNNVFTYDMTFFADGLLLQESTTFGPMRELSWRRIAADEVLLSGGVKMRASLSGKDQMTAENLGNRAKWECRKLQD
jgi:hypothetical protein